MSLTHIMQIGLSGVQAATDAVQTASNNVTNENTPGYAAESVILSENFAGGQPPLGGLGNGVSATAVARKFSQYAQSQVLSATSLSAAYSGQQALFTNLQSLFPLSSSGSAGIDAAITGFFDAAQTLSAAPANLPDRQSLLSAAGVLASQINSAAGTIQSAQTGISQQATDLVSAVNQVTGQLAAINKTLLAVPAGQQSPNSLLDQQSALLLQLAGNIGISTVQNASGTLSVFTKSGLTLVDGQSSYDLAAVSGGTFKNGQTDIVYQPNGASVTGKITGGQLGGVLSFQNTLQTTQLQLGLLSQGVAAVTNGQQALGVTPGGQQGTPIFAINGPTVFPGAANNGTATVTATIADLSTVPPTIWNLMYEGGQWVVTNGSTGAQSVVTPNASGVVTFGGMNVSITGAPANGDQFLIDPSGASAASLRVVMTDPGQVAAAIPYVASPGTIQNGGLVNTNLGQESLSAGQVVSSGTVLGSGAAVVPSGSSGYFGQTLTLQFTSGSAFHITTSGGTSVASGIWGGEGSQAVAFQYPSPPASGQYFVFDWSGGTPASGDAFTFTVAGAGNNGNAVALAQDGTTPVLMQGSVSNAYADMVNSFGNAQQTVNAGTAVASATLDQAKKAESAISGVNLNTAAATISQYMEAYQASAAVIQTANQLFQSLLQAVGG